MGSFLETNTYTGWGRVHRASQQVARPTFVDEIPTLVRDARGRGLSLLAYGNGRSYGDECLNDGQALIDMRALDHFLAFDRSTGEIEVEAGVSLAAILAVAGTPREGRAWIPAVLPGTKFVTVGGAIANDVHGKNHHVAGCFGRHVRSFRLMRTDGSVLECSAASNPELFRATIGGMGLTGLILSARLQLAAVPGPWLETEDIRFGSLDEYRQLTDGSADGWHHTVAWVDCRAQGSALGRGIFTRARSIPNGRAAPVPAQEPRFSLPVELPHVLMNGVTLAAFNTAYWHRIPANGRRRIAHYDPVLFPLDIAGHWNRLYGRRGFYQYQCVVPRPAAMEALREMLAAIAASGQGSFLAVLKGLGDLPSPGMMSFPIEGDTLALDFPNRGRETTQLLDRLDAITFAAGGRVYAAKDGRVDGKQFRASFASFDAFAAQVDPGISSTQWRRLTAPDRK